MIDTLMLKWAFFYAIISRVYRHWYKRKHEMRVTVNLPEGVKFLTTMVFIYIVGLAFYHTTRGFSLFITELFY